MIKDDNCHKEEIYAYRYSSYIYGTSHNVVSN